MLASREATADNRPIDVSWLGQDVTPLARRDCVRNPPPVFAPAVAVVDASPPVQPSSPVAAGEKTLPPTVPPVSLDLAVMQERYPLLRNAL